MFHDVIKKKYHHHFLLTTTDYQDQPFNFTIRDLRGEMKDASGRYTRLYLPGVKSWRVVTGNEER